MSNNISLKIEGEKLKGLQKIQEVLEKYSKSYIKVGLFGGNHPSSGESLPSIGALHEFGSNSPRTFTYKGEKIKISGLPARSWLRLPLKIKRVQLKGKGYEGKEFFKRVIVSELKNGYTGVALKFLGRNATNIIDEAFNTQGFGNWEPNINKRYVELKGSNIPLIDTGALRNAVTYKIVEGGQQ